MKVIVEIPDGLLEELRALASEAGTTPDAIVVATLREVLKSRRSGNPFRLRDASVDGQGLAPGVDEVSWERIRNLVYRGRGG
jgi:hypothetical protein